MFYIIRGCCNNFPYTFHSTHVNEANRNTSSNTNCNTEMACNGNVAHALTNAILLCHPRLFIQFLRNIHRRPPALSQIHSFILFFSKFNYNIKQTEIKQEKMKLNGKKKN